MPTHELARTLAARLEGIHDPAMRVRYVRHLVRELAPGTIAELVTVAIHGTEARDGSSGALLLSLCLALADEECAPLRDEVASAARRAGHADAAALLARPPAPAPEERAVPDFGVGRPLALGERKALARRRDRDLIARVLRDPHPDVIRVLLGNPTLTEDDVLRLCARRPIAPDVLREVFRHTRWIVCYRVRLAIVKNPCAPIDVALALCAHLTAPDARTVASSPELAWPVREACNRVARTVTLH